MRFMTMLALASGLLLATTSEASAFGKRRSSSCGGSSGAASQSSGCAPCGSGFSGTSAGYNQAAYGPQPCNNCPTGLGTPVYTQQQIQPSAVPTKILPGQAPPMPMTTTLKELPTGAVQVYWHPQHGYITIQK